MCSIVIWWKTKRPIPDDLAHELGISKEDMMMYYTDASVYNMPLTAKSESRFVGA